VIAEITTNSWWLIIGAWVITLGALGWYSVVIVLKGRRLSRQVPAASRRWL
jgi:hypothetical protein